MTRRDRAGRPASASGFRVGPGMVVEFGYELFDAEGELVEASDPDEPVEILVGYGQGAPALERLLDGLPVGGSRETRVSAEEAFGARDPEGIILVDRAELPGATVGDELVADREDGAVVALKVVEVEEDVVVLDTNHPLAGQRIRLRVQIRSIRAATDDEVHAAVLELERASGATPPLLPAERLLRRGPGQAPPGATGPPVPPTSVA